MPEEPTIKLTLTKSVSMSGKTHTKSVSTELTHTEVAGSLWSTGLMRELTDRLFTQLDAATPEEEPKKK